MEKILQLDPLDKKIMCELDLNARISASQLARKLKKSKETINFRINRLLKNNYIKGFYTIFNTSKLGWFYYKFYIKFKNIAPEKEKDLFEYIQKQKNIAYLGNSEGYFGCLFLVMIKSPEQINDFMIPFMKKYGKFIQEKQIHTVLAGHRFNEKFLFKGEENKDFCYNEKIENYKLDKIDKKILNIISSNSRMSLIEIAKKLKVDHKLVKYRMKKLEKNNIILAYVSSPNFDKLNLEFVQINISLNDPSIKNEIINYFNSTNKCLFALELLGRYDLSIEIHVENSLELKQIIDNFRKKFVNQYNEYDLLSITKEYVMVWSPFN